MSNGFETEFERFNQVSQCINLTGECARRFLADLKKGKGPDSAEADQESGRVIGSEEARIRDWLKRG